MTMFPSINTARSA